MTGLQRALVKAQRLCPNVVFPEWDEPRIEAARTRLTERGICTPIPLSDISDRLTDTLVSVRGVKSSIAHRMLGKPLVRAAAMVAAGEADILVAGIENPTRRVIEAAGLSIGLADGVSLPSSIFYMVFPDEREFVFGDCAVNVAPSAKELADIARASRISALALLGEARVAMLSFSTGTSGIGPSVDQVREAAEITGFAGPVQADAALNPSIAATKGIEPIDANTLIFPNLDAGNIAYKLCQELGGAQAIGPLLQGFAKPVCDLSRGASVDDIVASTIMTIAMSDPQESCEFTSDQDD